MRWASPPRGRCASSVPAPVRRETMETAAVVTRVAPSFIRFGHFEHFAHTAGTAPRCARLADASDRALYPACRSRRPVAGTADRRQPAHRPLLARWQAVGFCHGVMNTDNMSILGLTIDYGPFGFLDAFDPMHICNHTDTKVAMPSPASPAWPSGTCMRWPTACCR
jgi:uncharacterized protein YdiU (UPF0061 family)